MPAAHAPSICSFHLGLEHCSLGACTPPDTILTIVKCISTKRTATRIAALEPLEQTPAMEQILASPTPLTRQLLVRPNNTIANRTLALPFQRSLDVLPPSRQAVDERAARGGETDDALRSEEPAVPFFRADADTVESFDEDTGEGIGGWEADDDRHDLVIDGVAGGYFARFGGHFDLHGLVVRGLGGDPGGDV